MYLRNQNFDKNFSLTELFVKQLHAIYPTYFIWHDYDSFENTDKSIRVVHVYDIKRCFFYEARKKKVIQVGYNPTWN